jgi:hypothetical protein
LINGHIGKLLDTVPVSDISDYVSLLRAFQEHSGPLMKGLHEWMEAQLAEHKTEPNSGLGKAISYRFWSKYSNVLKPWVMSSRAERLPWKTLRHQM